MYGAQSHVLWGVDIRLRQWLRMIAMITIGITGDPEEHQGDGEHVGQDGGGGGGRGGALHV